MKSTQQILNHSNDQHRAFIFGKYHTYCGKWSQNGRDCQNLLANPALFKFWKKNYDRMNAKFERRVAGMADHLERSTILAYHAETIQPAMEFFSRPLLRNARKNRTLNAKLN